MVFRAAGTGFYGLSGLFAAVLLPIMISAAVPEMGQNARPA
ncbi:MAG: hypothetical protein ABF785_12095 [Acetobacter papayae]